MKKLNPIQIFFIWIWPFIHYFILLLYLNSIRDGFSYLYTVLNTINFFMLGFFIGKRARSKNGKSQN